MTRRTHRRQFLKETAAAGLGFWVAGGVALQGQPGGQRRSQHRLHRRRRQGRQRQFDMPARTATSSPSATSTTDYLDKKAEEFPKAKKFNDFRKMFDEMGKTIDAVTSARPTTSTPSPA